MHICTYIGHGQNTFFPKILYIVLNEKKKQDYSKSHAILAQCALFKRFNTYTNIEIFHGYFVYIVWNHNSIINCSICSLITHPINL